jgi:hypothetical protein
MPAPIDPAKRALIEQAIRDGAGQVSRNAIAKQFGVAGSTVGKIATEAGLTEAFDRTKTERATRARSVDLADVRLRLQERWAAKANEALDRSERECQVFAFGGQFNEFSSEILPLPPAADYRSFVTAAAVATDKMVALAKYDAADDGVAGAVSAIENIMDALRGNPGD